MICWFSWCPLEYLLVPSFVPLPTLGTYLIDNMSLPYVMLSLHKISPKHHLLAAYDNSLTTLSWLSCEATQRDNENGRDEDLWLLVCDIVGKKIMNHLIVKGSDWNPLKIRGEMMVQPSFGGEQCNCLNLLFEAIDLIFV